MKNEKEGKLISRHEVKCNLEDIIKTSNYLLKNNGEFFMVHRPERLVDIFYLLRKHKIEPKILRIIYNNKNSKPKLLLIKGVKNGKSFLNIEEPLFIYDEAGNYTDKIKEIYNMGE